MYKNVDNLLILNIEKKIVNKLETNKFTILTRKMLMSLLDY